MANPAQTARAERATAWATQDVADTLAEGRTTEITGSNPTYLALALRDIARRANRPLVIVTTTNRAARDTHETLVEVRGGAGRDYVMPAPEVSPYNDTSPDRQLSLQRMELLAAAPSLTVADTLVVPALGWAARCPPPEALRELTLSFELEDDLDIGKLRRVLSEGGYAEVGLVEDRGTFSIRGDVVDIFSPADSEPVRIELYGDMVESIRRFDPTSQRSGETILSYRFTPVQEIALTEETRQRAVDKLGELAAEYRVPSRVLSAVCRDIRSDSRFFGIEALKPAFYERLARFDEYLPDDALIAWMEPEAARNELESHLERRQEEFERELAEERLYFPPSAYFVTSEELNETTKSRALVAVRQLSEGGEQTFPFYTEDNTDVVRIRKRTDASDDRFREFVALFDSWQDLYSRVVFVCSSRAGASRLASLLRENGIDAARRDGRLDLSPAPFNGNPEFSIYVSGLREGFRSLALGTAVITEAELLGRSRRVSGESSAGEALTLSSFRDIGIGDLLVHIDFGIGRYHGLQRIDAGDGVETEFLVIEYAGDDKLYLPIFRLERVQKYVGSAEYSKLDKLGGTGWEKTRNRIKSQIEGIAHELLKIYAERARKVGYKFSDPDEDYFDFEASFPWEETPHQQKAIDDVLADMTSPRPMDRLVCGDVGFGKTEVAIRGAYKAVLDGAQVAVLVPTTVLADQHLSSFASRLADTPARIGMVSRFRSGKQIKETLEQLKQGSLDIVIGTHRLLSKDIEFKNLGLLIVDEEQRFGVRHKEKIKELKANIDVLTLSATPIPRTLEMSLLGIRDLSIIMTPPAGRLSIRTHIAKFKDNTIREGIERELERGGQVFFVHNRVETIHNMASELNRIVPSARTVVAHAQMSPSELEDIMHDFINRKYDVLVSTTIIESGIDISSANTIFINDANRFGLSQLYQLRGRVGRGSKRAYCYLLARSPNKLKPDARRRLEVLQQHTDLGSGMQIAHHDLDMRGAGNILGRDQSGHIESVGFELFSELLQETIDELRGEEHAQRYEPEVRIPVASFIPDEYVEDIKQRLLFYKRFSMAESNADVHEVFDELQDRYGRAPDCVEALKQVVLVKLALRRVRAEKLEMGKQHVIVQLREDTVMEPGQVMALIRDFNGQYSFSPDMRLTRKLSAAEQGDPLAAALATMRELEQAAQV